MHRSAFTYLSIHYYYIVDYHITLPYNPDKHTDNTLRINTKDNTLRINKPLSKMLLSSKTRYGWGIKLCWAKAHCRLLQYIVSFFCLQQRIYFSLSNSRFHIHKHSSITLYLSFHLRRNPRGTFGSFCKIELFFCISHQIINYKLYTFTQNEFHSSH
jgi:hypothetical protein